MHPVRLSPESLLLNLPGLQVQSGDLFFVLPALPIWDGFMKAAMGLFTGLY